MYYCILTPRYTNLLVGQTGVDTVGHSPSPVQGIMVKKINVVTASESVMDFQLTNNVSHECLCHPISIRNGAAILASWRDSVVSSVQTNNLRASVSIEVPSCIVCGYCSVVRVHPSSYTAAISSVSDTQECVVTFSDVTHQKHRVVGMSLSSEFKAQSFDISAHIN